MAQTINRHVVILFLGSLAALVSAEVTANSFSSSWPKATGRVISVALVLAFIFGLVIIFLEIRKSLKAKQEIKAMALATFETYAKKLSLNRAETAFLTRVAALSGAPSPDLVLTKLYYFEMGVARELENAGQSPLLLKNLCDTITSLRKKLGFDHVPLEMQYYSTRELTVDLEVTLVTAAAPGVKFRSRVVRVNELDLTVARPITREEANILNAGDEITVAVYKPGDGEYSFVTDITAVIDDKKALVLKHSLDLTRKQLREYVRLEVRNQAKFRFLKADAAPDRLKGGTRFAGTLVDISGGGCNLETAEEYNAGDVIMLSFNFQGEAFYGIKGTVLRIMSRTVRGEAVFSNHIQFLDIETNARERIIHLIFEKQREDVQWQKTSPL